MGKKIIIEPGTRFGRWTVLEEADKRDKLGNVYYKCACDCGTVRDVCSSILRRGQSTSCGCYQKEHASKQSTKHGLHKTRLNSIRANMLQRCFNEKEVSYKNYGGRWISVCDEWRDSLPAFYDWAMANGYREGLTLDRIDVNGDYCPENCRWATDKEQANNKRNSAMVEINGEIKTLSEWAEHSGIRRTTLRRRLELGWDSSDLLKPVNKKNSHSDAIKKGMERKRKSR